MTGGALAVDDHWLEVNNDIFLFPVKALALVFRRKFLDGLGNVRDKVELDIRAGDHDEATWSRRVAKLRKKPWVFGPLAVIAP